jgi:hypothetical protein
VDRALQDAKGRLRRAPQDVRGKLRRAPQNVKSKLKRVPQDVKGGLKRAPQDVRGKLKISHPFPNPAHRLPPPCIAILDDGQDQRAKRDGAEAVCSDCTTSLHVPRG